MIQLSPGQIAAKEKVNAWLEQCERERASTAGTQRPKPSKPVFKLQGYAGTGKTTVIKALLERFTTKNEVATDDVASVEAQIANLRSHASFAAFTGKAALVMSRNGLPAQTIHSLIYKPKPTDVEKCERLFKAIKSTTDKAEKAKLKAELAETQKVSFRRQDSSETDLVKKKVLVLDECSMVNQVMLNDLLSFNVPILALGDPGQLPPIDGTGALTVGTPDVLLTEIHRQAADNPIIEYATRARTGMALVYGERGGSKVVAQGKLTAREVLGVDQILAGKNATRQMLNQRIRTLRGFSGTYPCVGEKLICLRNDAEKGLFNGLMGEVVEVGDLYGATIELKIKLETQQPDEPPIVVEALRAHFDAYSDKDALENVKWWDKRGAQEFDFGYAITVHKSQGSQWDNVILWDDGMFKWGRDHAETRKQWLYTGITRAAQNIIVAEK